MASQCGSGRLFYVHIHPDYVQIFGLKYEAERAWERAGCEGKIVARRYGERIERGDQ